MVRRGAIITEREAEERGQIKKRRNLHAIVDEKDRTFIWLQRHSSSRLPPSGAPSTRPCAQIPSERRTVECGTGDRVCGGQKEVLLHPVGFEPTPIS